MAEHPENQEQTERKNRRFAVSANRKSAPFVRPFPILSMPGELKPLKCLAILTPASVLIVKFKKPALILRRSQIA